MRSVPWRAGGGSTRLLLSSHWSSFPVAHPEPGGHRWERVEKKKRRHLCCSCGECREEGGDSELGSLLELVRHGGGSRIEGRLSGAVRIAKEIGSRVAFRIESWPDRSGLSSSLFPGTLLEILVLCILSLRKGYRSSTTNPIVLD